MDDPDCTLQEEKVWGLPPILKETSEWLPKDGRLTSNLLKTDENLQMFITWREREIEVVE